MAVRERAAELDASCAESARNDVQPTWISAAVACAGSRDRTSARDIAADSGRYARIHQRAGAIEVGGGTRGIIGFLRRSCQAQQQ